VRFGFREIPEEMGVVRPRPIVDVVVEGFDIAPQACLLDSGATAIRFGTHVAEMCGIELREGPDMQIAVGGALVAARMAEVGLFLTDGEESHEWSAPAWFCDPWIPGFGLLGLTGFFDRFEVTIAAYEERIELTPVS
jgi:hypothetical protein